MAGIEFPGHFFGLITGTVVRLLFVGAGLRYNGQRHYPGGGRMERSTISRILRRAAADEEFRRRAIDNLGMALAQEGFLLTDGEMSHMRSMWEEIEALNVRGATERLQALARLHRH